MTRARIVAFGKEPEGGMIQRRRETEDANPGNMQTNEANDASAPSFAPQESANLSFENSRRNIPQAGDQKRNSIFKRFRA